MRQNKNIFMRLSSRRFLLFVLVAILCSSCYQDVIDLDLSEIERQIVIVGRIEEGSTSNYIEIARTGDLSDVSNVEYVGNAEVIITDNLGNTETLAELTTGRYRSSNITGEVGRAYTLNILTEGKEYNATSYMPHPIEIESIEFHRISQYDDVHIVSISFQDIADVPDFAMIKIYKNNYLQDVRFYQDKYSDGEMITIDDFKVQIYPRQDILIKVISLDQDTYRYLNMLVQEEEDIDDQDSGEVDYSDLILSPNYNPRSNISNNALGYFSAQVVRSYRTSLQP